MKKVFLVDDEKSILNWLESSIHWNEFGCSIVGSSTNSVSALRRLQKEKVDILITDITMPDMDGLTLIKRMKAFQPDLHVIIISAYSDFSYAKEAIHLGTEDYILKPLNQLELEEALKRVSLSINFVSSPEQKVESNDDLMVFKSNMLQRWVKGSDNLADFNEQMELAEIDISKGQYSVFIVHIKNLNKDKMLQVFRLCDKYIGSLSNGIYFDSFTDIVGILSGEEAENREALSKMYVLLKEQFIADIYISLGEVVSHYLQVKNSYQSAKFFRLAGLFTKEDVFVNKKEFSPTVLLANPAYRSLRLQLEDKNVNKSFESALKMCTSSTKKQKNEVSNNLILVVALSFLNTFEGVLDSTEAEVLYSIIDDFNHLPNLDWLIKYITIIRKYYNKQLNSLHPYVLKVMNFVEEDFSNPDLNLSILADRLKVTPVYLGQIFYSQTESHFNEYLTDFRLKEVCNLLTTTPTKIGDVAKQVGFSSQSYLNRVFRKKYHLTPLDYRQLSN